MGAYCFYLFILFFFFLGGGGGGGGVLDFSKTFMPADHEIPSSELRHYGILGIASNWFKSCLENKKQFVTYDGVEYNLQLIRCGLLHGSILGPLLYLIYINDVTDVCKCMSQFMFRYHHKKLPKISDECFPKHSAVHKYSTGQSDPYRLPDYEKGIGRNRILFVWVNGLFPNYPC